MKHIILVAIFLASCGGKGDDSAMLADERQCIFFFDTDVDTILDAIDDEPTLGDVQVIPVNGNVETCNTTITTDLIVETIGEVNPGLLARAYIEAA